MKTTEHVRCAFDDGANNKLESAMLHACISVDATAKRLYPSITGTGRRFVKCLREYYWLIEPMVGVGLNLEETKFENITIPRLTTPPDFADVIYSIHRNNHAHGEEVPLGYEFIRTQGGFDSSWELAANLLRMPDRVIWALIAVTVFCRENYRYRGWGETRYLFWGNEKFTISEWWGKEAELKPIAARWNTTRVTMKELGRLKDAAETGQNELGRVFIVPPAPINSGGA